VAGSWTTISVPDTSTGAVTADIMLLLTDGSVLVHNGYTVDAPLSYSNQWVRLWPDNNGKYETGTWSNQQIPANSYNMQYARQFFASGVMSDGRVFVIGGEYSDDPAAPDIGPGGMNDAWSGEIYDPQGPLDSAWTPIDKPFPGFQFVRGDCNGSVLDDGRVLLGGASTTEPPPTWSNQTAIWDPSDNKWVQAGLGGAAKEDPFEEETFCLLPDGSVLAPAVRDTPKAQRYLPSPLDQWVDCEPSKVPLAVISVGTPPNTVPEYETGPTILLPSGAAFAIGGTGFTGLYTPPPASDPAGKGSWTQGPSFPPDMSANPLWATLTALDAPACLLPSGKVVCMGGTTQADGLGSKNPVLLEYDPASTAATLPPLDVQPELPDVPGGSYTWKSFMLLLPTGQLLLSAQANTLLLYSPDPATSAPQDAWRPTIGSVPGVMVPGNSYTITGTQFNGLSQAVCYGDDAGMATNYPIVRLTNPSTGQVVYARSYGFSSMGVATGTTVQSCTIEIPSYLANEAPPRQVSLGEWDLVVIANGIPSEQVTVNLRINPCQGIIDNPPNAGDYNTIAEFKQALSDWRREVEACLEEYGLQL
jgi:hypothetical protein